MTFALNTGFRQANQFGLPWSDVNFETGVVTARGSKSGETYHVPINDALRGMLRGLESRLKGAWVFPNLSGKSPINATNYMNRVFGPALERAEIEDFRWHDLRHTFASRLVMAGVDLSTVKELMGHKTITMTQRYAHLSPAHKLSAVQRLGSRTTGTTTGTTSAPDEERPRPSPQVRDRKAEKRAGDRGRTGDVQLGKLISGTEQVPATTTERRVFATLFDDPLFDREPPRSTKCAAVLTPLLPPRFEGVKPSPPERSGRSDIASDRRLPALPTVLGPSNLDGPPAGSTLEVMARIIAISNQKGGVGKTTTALSLAHALAADGDTRVLLCDLDPQASLTASLGVDARSLAATVYDLLVDARPGLTAQDVILETSTPGVHLLPSTIDLSKAELELISEINREHVLSSVLKTVADRYDFMVLDCPPSLGLLTTNALTAADELVIPLSSDYLAFRALEHLLVTVTKIRTKVNPRLKDTRILVTMHQGRTVHGRAILDEIQKAFPEAVFSSIVPYSVRAKDSVAVGKSIISYDPASPVAEAYSSVAAELRRHD